MLNLRLATMHDFARQGIGSLIMQECEQGAKVKDYRSLEFSPLSGLHLY